MSMPEDLVDDLPIVDVTDRRLRELTDEALDVLMAANDPPALFVRLGDLVRVVRDEKGRARLARVGEQQLRHRLARVCDFVRVRTTGKPAGTATPVPPPPEVVQDILAGGAWSFPALEGVTTVPILRPDGTVLVDPGYDAETRLVYVPDPALALPSVPDEPTEDQLAAARERVFDVLQDFAFADFASMANAMALMMTPILRPAIDGLVPLALLDKPKRGTGATLLARVITTVAFGSATDLMTAPSSDEEWRKKLTSALLAGLTIIFIDNVEGVLSSSHLAACLTSEHWSDRILGRSEIARDLVQRATWIATGNNLRVGGDLGRRCYHIRMDARLARPWTRDGFRHRHLLRHVRRTRGEILSAMLTIVRGWFAAGCPSAETPTVGGFEEWTRVLGGVLAMIGVPGFLENLSGLYEDVDEDDTAWATFLAGWHGTFGDTPTTVAEIAAVVKGEASSLRDVLPGDVLDTLNGKAKTSFERKLGAALRKQAGAIFGDYRLDRAGVRHQAVKWKVTRGSQDSQGSQFSPEGSSANESPRGGPTGTDSPISPDSPVNGSGRAPGWSCRACASETRFEVKGQWLCGGCHRPASRAKSAKRVE